MTWGGNAKCYHATNKYNVTHDKRKKGIVRKCDIFEQRGKKAKNIEEKKNVTLFVDGPIP